MRSLLIVAVLAVGIGIVGCGKKSDSDAPAPAPTTNANTPAPTHSAVPCSGMVTDKDCQACCGAGHTWTFRGRGTCACK